MPKIVNEIKSIASEMLDVFQYLMKKDHITYKDGRTRNSLYKETNQKFSLCLRIFVVFVSVQRQSKGEVPETLIFYTGIDLTSVSNVD